MKRLRPMQCSKPHMRCKITLWFAIFLAMLIVFSKLRSFKSYYDMVCKEDLQTGEVLCRPTCPKGFFSLPGMKLCHPWLKCDAIKNEVTSLNISVGNGQMKKISKAFWQNHTVILNECDGIHIKYMYYTVLEHLRNLQPSNNVIQLIGYCGLTYVTEFHPLGSAQNYKHLLQSPSLQKHNNIRTRLATCVSYIEAVHYMHNSPIGTRILQDTHHLGKCLSQFLVTSDLKVVLNDLDMLPEADPEAGLIAEDYKKPEPKNHFIAPERFHFTNYDEKADIWIIPAVCKSFLDSEYKNVKDQLSEINLRCKRQRPAERPTAAEVLDVYRRVLLNVG